MIKRKLENILFEHLKKKEISLITGARQVGKTTLMMLLKSKLDTKGKKTLYLNLDIESDRVHLSSQDSLLNKIRLEYGENKVYVFIDEIQRKENAGLFLKGIADMNLPHKFILSGSGSIELKEKIHESLAGRKRVFILEPVSFYEFVNYKTENKYETKLLDFFKIEKNKVDELLNEYLLYGGYPAVVTEMQSIEKFKIMEEIFNSYIAKDISFLLKVEKVDVYSYLIRLLASQTGKILNYSNLSSAARISFPSLKKYLWYSEKTYITKFVSPFFKNFKKELTKSPVVYFTDIGLLNYSTGNFGNVRINNLNGYRFQNFVYNILDELSRDKSWNLNYWRTSDGAEVDFIINKYNSVIPIEVKYSKLKKPVFTKGLRSFINKYNPLKAYIINLNFNEVQTLNNTQLIFLPYHKLLFEEI